MNETSSLTLPVVTIDLQSIRNTYVQSQDCQVHPVPRMALIGRIHRSHRLSYFPVNCITVLYFPPRRCNTIVAGYRSMFLAKENRVLHRNLEIGSPNAALPHTLLGHG